MPGNNQSILHVTSGLGEGGVEAIIYSILSHDSNFNHVVISIGAPVNYVNRIQELGVKVYVCPIVGIKSFFDAAKLFFNTYGAIRPKVVQAWMYHANFFVAIMSIFLPKMKLIMAIHNGELSFSRMKLLTIVLAVFGSFLSRVTRCKVIFCSECSAAYHIKLGYPKTRVSVIPNGYDVNLFSPSKDLDIPESGKELLLAKPRDTVVFGMIARFDPIKDHDNLFEAVKVFSLVHPGRFKLRLIGSGMEDTNVSLLRMIDKYCVRDHLELIGSTSQPVVEIRRLDIHLLSSYSESFPNVVAEAMACGVPCISTNVGDVSLIIGDTGWLVPRCSPNSLANAMLESVQEMKNLQAWNSRRLNCVNRIRDRYSLNLMVERYTSKWNE